MADEMQLSEDVVRDLRAIYDASHEAIKQRDCSIEDLSVAEISKLAGISPRRTILAFGTDPVPNATFWADLHADVQMMGDSRPTYTSLHSGLAEFADRLTSKDPIEMALVARELVRRSTNTNSDVLASRNKWALRDASVAANGSPTIENLSRFASLRRVDAVSRLRYVELYGSVAQVLGLRPREPMTIDEFTNAVIATIEGLMMNSSGAGPNVELLRPTGPNGGMQRWTTAGVVFEALALSSLEPDPWAETAADLSVWHSPATTDTHKTPLPTS